MTLALKNGSDLMSVALSIALSARAARASSRRDGLLLIFAKLLDARAPRISHALLKKVSEVVKLAEPAGTTNAARISPDNRYFIPECLSPEYATEIRFLFGNLALRLRAQASIGSRNPRGRS